MHCVIIRLLRVNTALDGGSHRHEKLDKYDQEAPYAASGSLRAAYRGDRRYAPVHRGNRRRSASDTCAAGTPAGTACTFTGTLTLTSGILALTAPPAVAWAETISGADQQLADPAPADETYTVDDATGTAPGWHVTASATAFAIPARRHYYSGDCGGDLLADVLHQRKHSPLAAGADCATAPGANCGGTSTCIAADPRHSASDVPGGHHRPRAAATRDTRRIYNADAGYRPGDDRSRIRRSHRRPTRSDGGSTCRRIPFRARTPLRSPWTSSPRRE